MTQKPLLWLTGIAALVVLLIWVVQRQRRGLAAFQAQTYQANRERDDALARLETQAKAISELENSLKEAAARASLAKLPPSSDEPFENALDVWLGKVRKLNAYLDKHPEKRISQMNLLTAADWLDVTKETKLESEAEMRKALAKLRGLARQKTAGTVGKALAQAVAANGGQAPANVQLLAPYLPTGFDFAILQQLAINPSGEVPGLRTIGGRSQYFLVDKPVDGLWDSTLFYDQNGKWGVRGAVAPGESDVSSAIAQFTSATGAPPTTATQLTSYPKIAAMKPSVLEELFKAVTTTPDR